MKKKQSILLTSILFIFNISISNAQVNKINYDSLRTVLEKMVDEDQEIRRILVDSIGFDSPESGKYINEMATIDKRNKTQIEWILKKYGWIEQRNIGVKAAEAIFYCVQHTNVEFLEAYFPQFKKLAEKGEANPSLCAMMEDRLLMWKGKKQIYGTQATNTLRPDKKYAIWPIENPLNVNERRKKVGFKSTVEENAKRMDADYDPKEKLPTEKN